MNLGFDEIDVFSDVNSLYGDEWEEDDESTLENFKQGISVAEEELKQSDPILHKIGINSSGFNDNDRMEALRRINYYMGYRDDTSQYSYNKIYAYDVDVDSVETLEEKEVLSIAGELEMYRTILDNTIKQIVSANNSSHADVNSDYLKSELLTNIKEHNNNFEDEEFNSNAVATIREMLSEIDELDSEKVFERIIENFPEKAFVYYANRDKYIQSISYLVNLYSTSMKKAYYYQKMHENTSESIVFLFKKDKKDLENLIEENKQHNVVYVKQVIQNDNDFFIKCICGKHVKISLASKLFIYGENDNFNIDYFPLGTRCPYCGKIHIFSENDLAEYIALFKIKYSDILKNFVVSSIKNCHSGSFGKYKVSIPKISEFFTNDMLTDKIDDIDIVIDNNNEEVVDPFAVELQSDKAYMEAITDFEKQINNFSKDTQMLKPGLFNIRSGNKIIHSFDIKKAGIERDSEISKELQEQIEHLENYSKTNKTTTYGVMATFLASQINLDYRKTKNRAIFSLLLSIQSNPVIRAYTGLGDLNEMYANLKDLQECLSFSSSAFPVGYKSIFANILSTYNIRIPNVESFDVEDFWTKAIELQKDLKRKIEDYEVNLEELKNLLYAMEEALIYTKIVNVNSMQLSEISYLLADEQFAQFCDRVADRMIITNYAEKIVSWRSKTANDLNKVQDIKTFRETCIAFINSGLEGYRMVQNSEAFNKNKFQILDKYYKVTKDTSFLKISASADIYDALKKCDYARAIKMCYKMSLDAVQLGDSCAELVTRACEHINSFYEKRVDLCALEDNTFYFVLAGFLVEEIDESCIYKFSTKHIPKRFEHETVEQYILRVKEDENVITVESSEIFKEIYKDLIVIMLISNACKLDMKSFVNTVFMKSTFDLIIDSMNYINVCDLFNISTDAYIMYENQVYESQLYFKDGKWFSALEFYNGSEEIMASLGLKSTDYENCLKVSVGDSIKLKDVVQSYLDSMYTELEQLSEAKKPLSLNSKLEEQDTANLIMDFEPFTIMNYIRDFLEVK